MRAAHPAHSAMCPHVCVRVCVCEIYIYIYIYRERDRERDRERETHTECAPGKRVYRTGSEREAHEGSAPGAQRHVPARDQRVRFLPLNKRPL